MTAMPNPNLPVSLNFLTRESLQHRWVCVSQHFGNMPFFFCLINYKKEERELLVREQLCTM